MINLIKYGDVVEVWDANETKLLKYQQEIRHAGLKEVRIFSGKTIQSIERKIKVQLKRWEAEWQEIELKRGFDLEKKMKEKLAIKQTKMAEDVLAILENLLTFSIQRRDVIDSKNLHRKIKFPELPPSKPEGPFYLSFPEAPQESEDEFQPAKSFLTKRFPSLEKLFVKTAENSFWKAFEDWKKEIDYIELINDYFEKEFDIEILEYERELKEWKERQQAFFAEQRKINNRYEKLKDRYLKRDSTVVEEYARMVLENSIIPVYLKGEFLLEYNPKEKSISINYFLPDMDVLPKLKQVIYIPATDEFKQINRSQEELKTLYSHIAVSLLLRFIYEQYESDAIKALDQVHLAIWVNAVNPVTGKTEIINKISLKSSRKDFMNIILAKKDVWQLFKELQKKSLK